MAGCKALGLINKLLTGPLRYVLEGEMSILLLFRSCFKLSSKLSMFCERLLVDHLPGGIHDNPSEEMPDTVCTEDQQSVSETLLNLTGFKKPNATTIALESLILFSNKTREWLLQNILFSKMAPKLRKLYQEGRKAIQQHRVNGK